MLHQRYAFGFAFIAVLWMSALGAGEADLHTGNGWAFTRIWKSAKKGKYHFYEGKLPLRNASGQDLSDVRAQVSIWDVSGVKINSSKWVKYGRIRAGKTLNKPFLIERAVQFSELKVVVRYKKGGKDGEVTLTTNNGNVAPEPMVAGGGDTLEVRILGESIDKAVQGSKTERYATMQVRVRNMANVPAINPTVKITFKLAKGEPAKSTKKKSTRTTRSARRKKSSKKTSKKEEPPKDVPVAVVSGDTAVMTVVLEKGELKPGQTKTYSRQIDAPEFLGYSMALSAEWPETETVTEEVITTGGETTGDGGQVVLGQLKQEAGEGGKSTLIIPVQNNGPEIAANQLKIELYFMNKAGKEIAKISAAYDKVLPKGAKAEVRIPDQDVPDYHAYEVGMSF